MSDHLMRKKAVERLSSPEQLDTAMRVISPAGWIALAACAAIIVAAIIWGFVGLIPEKVDGTGILLKGETVRTVQTPAAGRVLELKVREGDLLVADQIIATFELPELEAEIKAAKDRVSDLQGERSSQSSGLQGLQASYATQLRNLEEQRANKQRLFERGLARRQDVLAIESQIAGIRAQIFQTQVGDSGRGNQLDEAVRKLEQLRQNFETRSVLRTPYPGLVAAVLTAPGELLQAGARVLNLEEADEPYRVLIFVPFSEGKRVEKGMVVRVSPTSVKPEEFGWIVGKIDEVSRQPVTQEEVKRTLNNDQLAQKFAKDTPFRVRVVPELDPESPSGFKWTSAKGPPFPVSSSTPCSAQIVVSERQPISYVIPLTKKALGMG
jgi:HlyD family secretion protein